MNQYCSKDNNINKLYFLKESFLENMFSNNFKYIYDNIYELVGYIVGIKDLKKVINDYVGFIEYFDNLDVNKITANIKNTYLELFNTFWNLIAIYNFKNSIKEYYNLNNLDIEQLNYKFDLEININKEKFNELLDLFYNKFYLEENLDASRSDNIKKILSGE
jgi:hypothetical protein